MKRNNFEFLTIISFSVMKTFFSTSMIFFTFLNFPSLFNKSIKTYTNTFFSFLVISQYFFLLFRHRLNHWILHYMNNVLINFLTNCANILFHLINKLQYLCRLFLALLSNSNTHMIFTKFQICVTLLIFNSCLTNFNYLKSLFRFFEFCLHFFCHHQFCRFISSSSHFFFCSNIFCHSFHSICYNNILR